MNGRDWNIVGDISVELVDGHQVVTLRTQLPDDVRITRFRSRPVLGEFSVELRLRKLPAGDPLIKQVPTNLFGNFAVSEDESFSDRFRLVKGMVAEANRQMPDPEPESDAPLREAEKIMKSET